MSSPARASGDPARAEARSSAVPAAGAAPHAVSAQRSGARRRGGLHALRGGPIALDRSEATFVALAHEFMRAPLRSPSGAVMLAEANGGYGMRAIDAAVYAALIECIGEPRDGKRGPFIPLGPDGRRLNVNGAYLCERYGFTYTQLKAATESLGQPHPCPRCARGHRLVDVRPQRARGASVGFELVRCEDVAPTAAIPWEQAIRTRESGPRDARGRFHGDAVEPGAQGELAFGGAGEVSGYTDTSERRPRARRVAPAAAAEPIALSIEPDEVEPDDFRLGLVRAIATFNGVELPDSLAQALVAIVGARAAADYEAAVIALVAFSSLSRASLASLHAGDVVQILRANPRFAAAGDLPEAVAEVSGTADRLQRRAAPPARAESTGDWAVDTLLAWARIKEPATSADVARLYRNELAAAIERVAGGPLPPSVLEERIRDVLTRRDLIGAVGAPIPTHIIARLRDGIAKGWLLRPPDPAARFARAFGELGDDRRTAAIAHVRAVITGELPSVNEQYLAGCGVYSRSMRDWLLQQVESGAARAP